MATAFQASCPNCKLKVTVSNSADEAGIATVTCEGCGKKFGLRFPKSDANAIKAIAQKAALRASTTTYDDPFTNLSGALPEQMGAANMNWENYQVRHKPLIAAKPLAIATGLTVAIISVVGLGILASQNAAEIDLSSIGASLQGPADTIYKIHSDWSRFDAEQKSLTASISRQSDCAALLFPLERLQERQLNLLIRAALLDPRTATALDGKNLPPRPSTSSNEARTFRSIEALLTKEFRGAERSLNLFSNAVLSHFHAESSPVAEPTNEAEKFSLSKTLIKRSLCRVLAEAHRGADESKTAVAIYELAEELKQLKTTHESSVVNKDSTLPDGYGYADFTVDQMQIALAERFTKDPKGDIAKALTAFGQAF